MTKNEFEQQNYKKKGFFFWNNHSWAEFDKNQLDNFVLWSSNISGYNTKYKLIPRVRKKALSGSYIVFFIFWTIVTRKPTLKKNELTNINLKFSHEFHQFCHKILSRILRKFTLIRNFHANFFLPTTVHLHDFDIRRFHFKKAFFWLLTNILGFSSSSS